MSAAVARVPDMTGVERIVYVGGPMDGQEETYMAGLGAIIVPVHVDGDEVESAAHSYVQADLLPQPQEPFSADGARRYVYTGPA